MSVTFDKLAFSRKLETNENFSRAQAETLADAFHDAVRDTVATRADLQMTEAALRHEIAALKGDLLLTIERTRMQILLGTGGMLVASFTIALGIARLIFS